MKYFIDKTAQVESNCIFGHNVVILENARIGRNVCLGHNVVIHANAEIGDYTIIEDGSVIGRQPRSSAISTRQVTQRPGIKIGVECVIGANVILYAGVELQQNVMVADLACIRENSIIKKYAIIGRGVLMEYDTVVGEYTKIQTGCHITGNMIIEDHVFFGPHVTTMNDKQMDRVKGTVFIGPYIKRGARIGSNSTLLSGIIIGFDSVVAAGAVVTKDVPDRKIVAGVPARIIKDVPVELYFTDERG